MCVKFVAVSIGKEYSYPSNAATVGRGAISYISFLIKAEMVKAAGKSSYC